MLITPFTFQRSPFVGLLYITANTVWDMMFSLWCSWACRSSGMCVWLCEWFKTSQGIIVHSSLKISRWRDHNNPQMMPTTRSVTLHHMSEHFSPLLIFSLALYPTAQHDTDPFQFSSKPITCFLKTHFNIICTLSLRIFTFLYGACYTGVLSVHLLLWIIAINTQYMKYGTGDFKSCWTMLIVVEMYQQ